MIEELRAKAKALGIAIDGRWKEAKLKAAIESVELAEAEEPAQLEGDHDRIDAMNAYALRVWEGQSPDMPKHQRIERVQSALDAQGWCDILDKLSLPNA